MFNAYFGFDLFFLVFVLFFMLCVYTNSCLLDRRGRQLVDLPTLYGYTEKQFIVLSQISITSNWYPGFLKSLGIEFKLNLRGTWSSIVWHIWQLRNLIVKYLNNKFKLNMRATISIIAWHVWQIRQIRNLFVKSLVNKLKLNLRDTLSSIVWHIWNNNTFYYIRSK